MSKLSIKSMITIALFAALMCILGPMSLPIGPIPISLTNLVIYLAVMLLGTTNGTISYGIYFLLGLIGLPVFSGYSGGLSKIVGPTGGFLVGFFFLAIVSGIFVNKFSKKPLLIFIGMVLGTLLAYLFGTIWFVILTKSTFIYALTVCVFPFLIGDAIKIIIAILIGTPIKRRLLSGGYLN